MLGSYYDSVLTWANDALAALGGKITPSAEASIRTEAAAAIQKAGGTQQDQQQVQADISTALKPYGGSSLPQYGGSPTDYLLPDLASSFSNLRNIALVVTGVGLLFWILSD